MKKGINSFASIGRAYEYHVIKVLEKYHFVLDHQGGRGDGGIDLKGLWNLSTSKSIPVIAQCKLTLLNPRIIREMEGVLSREIYSMNSIGNEKANKNNLLGFLISNNKLSDAGRIVLINSQFGFIYLKIDEKDFCIRDVIASKIVNDELLPDLVIGIQKINTMEKKYNFMYKNNILNN